MSELPRIDLDHPLDWPAGRAITPNHQTSEAKWRTGGRRLNFGQAMTRLRTQVGAMTKPGRAWRTTGMMLSTNYELIKDRSRPRAQQGIPYHAGAAFRFDMDGEHYHFACDQWDRVSDNIAAIAAHIEALRGQERWGVSDMKAAFAGNLAALPAPEQWWQVLGVQSDADSAAINAAYRKLAKQAHADAGGSDQAMSRLNTARDAGLKENGQLASFITTFPMSPLAKAAVR